MSYPTTYPTFGTAEAIGAWVNGLNQYYGRFTQLNPSTEWLKRQGLPTASQYLTGMSQNFADAVQKYAGMYRDKAVQEPGNAAT
jgi:hypothetical protein